MTERDADIGRTVRGLLLCLAAAFGFAFALVPLYDLICDVTGLGGKTGGRYVENPTEVVDQARQVKVTFIANNNDGMTWEFRPVEGQVAVHPGQLREVRFYVRNPTDRTIVAQAIPSLAPGSAAQYFHKTECFCFEQQQLGPGEEMEMPMRFLVSHDLPKSVVSLSLSYTLYDITDMVAAAPRRPADAS